MRAAGVHQRTPMLAPGAFEGLENFQTAICSRRGVRALWEDAAPASYRSPYCAHRLLVVASGGDSFLDLVNDGPTWETIGKQITLDLCISV